jgi:hypothetical protein
MRHGAGDQDPRVNDVQEPMGTLVWSQWGGWVAGPCINCSKRLFKRVCEPFTSTVANVCLNVAASRLHQL